ncbi:hypothetical protein [Streptosporangium sp. KLBMP 9127]|nr:hypothetical protein [Streptosporangium sp. KLBMP 9127]
MWSNKVGRGLVTVAVAALVGAVIAAVAQNASALLLLITALGLAAIGVVLLIPIRQGPQTGVRAGTPWPTRQLIREIWEAVHTFPDGWHATDPLTGAQITIQREKFTLTLLVREPFSEDRAIEREALVNRYFLGLLGRPVPGPLFRVTEPADDKPQPQRSWRQTRQELALAEQTGTDNASVQELVELRALLMRAIEAASDS